MATIFDRVVRCATQPTIGTKVVPTPAQSLRMQDVQLSVTSKNIDRTVVKQTMGNLPHVVGADAVLQAVITMELVPSGTAGVAPDWEPLMRACKTTRTISAGATTTFVPFSVDAANGTADNASTAVKIPSCSIEVYYDGLRYDMVSAVGDCSITFNPGEFPVGTFTMQSAYAAPVAVAAPVDSTYDGQVPHIAASSDVFLEGAASISNTTAGVAANVGAFTFNFGNDVQEHLTLGNHQMVVANRAPTITFTKDSISTAAEWNSLFTNTTTAQNTLHLALNGGAGLNTKLFCPNAKRVSVANGARAERVTHDITYNLFESVGGSDDQFTLELS